MNGYRQYPAHVVIEQIGKDWVDNVFDNWLQPDKYTTYFHVDGNRYLRIRLEFMDTWEVAYVEWYDDGKDVIWAKASEVYAFQIREVVESVFDLVAIA